MKQFYSPPAPAFDLDIGQTILVDDPGVYGYVPPSARAAVVLGFEPSKYHARYIVVQMVGVNLPKRIIDAQVLGHVSPAIVADDAVIEKVN